MKSVNTSLFDNQLSRTHMKKMYENKLQESVSVVIQGHELKLDEMIKESKLSNKSFDDFMEKVDKEILKTYKKVHNTAKRSLLDLVGNSVSYAYQSLETTCGDFLKINKPTRRVSEDIVLKRPIYKEATLASSWSGISVGERKRIETIIRKGIADGMTEADIALAIRKGNALNISRAQSKAIVTTAITSVSNQADQAVYKANKKILKGWQYVAIMDSHTTEICAHRNGRIYDIDDFEHLPPAHYNCRSTSVPVVKSWSDLNKSDAVLSIRKRNLTDVAESDLVKKFDGEADMRESYDEWLLTQPYAIQKRHLGSDRAVKIFNQGQLSAKQVLASDKRTMSISKMAQESSEVLSGDTQRFALAKEKLDAMRIGAATPDDILSDPEMQKTLREYYLLQSGELDGTLSLTNYRGISLTHKRNTRRATLTQLPTEKQLIFNPITGRYEDSRLYQPAPKLLENSTRKVLESEKLKQRDKDFILKFVEGLDRDMSINERTAVQENLRNLFARYREKGQVWENFKAVSTSQMKYDVMNVSESLEAAARAGKDPIKKLQQDLFIDPVLGNTTLDDVSARFVDNIKFKNRFENNTITSEVIKEMFSDVIADPNSIKGIARPLYWKGILRTELPPVLKVRLENTDLRKFYERLVRRLAASEMPDRDQLALQLGRDLYNMGNLNGNKDAWYKVGKAILESDRVKKLYELETYGVQKRRLRSRMTGKYFGPYYDTISYNIRVTDPRIVKYQKALREIDVGMRIPVVDPKNRLYTRPGYKTYFLDEGAKGWYDTGIPITSTASFSDFPPEFVDGDLAEAMNWMGSSKYKIDKDFHSFIRKLLEFKDDRGNAAKYDKLNEYRNYMMARGDTYERFKAMEWLTDKDAAFSNNTFIDHRARFYERGFIGPQAGESFRPFLNTEKAQALGVDGYNNFRDQVGSFLGGLDDRFEHKFNGLSFSGRREIEAYWRKDLVRIGNHMLRGKPSDIRAILEDKVVEGIDGEDLGKFYRFALESAKIDNWLKSKGFSNYSKAAINSLSEYRTALALEQDASSSGAQIIALTTRNKQLAELSNVVPTTQKKRLYDEIAALTYNDPRFKEINLKLGLSEKDLRKAAKAQNMVTFYGAGERTGAMNVEGKLSKVLDKKNDMLVVTAGERDKVLDQISAQAARYQKSDPLLYDELMDLRKVVRDIFNHGKPVTDDLIEELWFLDPETRQIVEKLSKRYGAVVTPKDFSDIAKIMSEHLGDQVPILKDFTRFFGRLAEDYLLNADPRQRAFSTQDLIKEIVFGVRKGLLDQYKKGKFANVPNGLLDRVARQYDFLEPITITQGVKINPYRKTGYKVPKTIVKMPWPLDKVIGEFKFFGSFRQKDVPKHWNNVPWVNFDGKIVEQYFTQAYEERLFYEVDGQKYMNILMVDQKNEASFWDQVLNKDFNPIDNSDVTKARTAFAVNGNHSNDATLVKRFHLWGKDHNVQTSSIHDAFFTNIADLTKGKQALRELYAESLSRNVVLETLNEMRARGLPKELYDKYLNEAIDKGLIPVAGRSKIGGRTLTEADILYVDDILKPVPSDFSRDYGWYGIGG